jgi:hypothetical protein
MGQASMACLLFGQSSSTCFFWWKDVLKLVNHFRGVTAVKAGKGDMLCFWSDNWDINGSTQPFKERRFPRLPSFVLDGNMSAAEVYSHET